MRERAPFQPADLAELDELFLQRASAVVAMQEVYSGNHRGDVIGMRHDCDAGHALRTALFMAEWEADRGYRSSYYVLHTSPYWGTPTFREELERIATLGHEIGIHNNALAESLRTGEHYEAILENAIDELRGWGFPVRGTAGHGDPFCNRDRAPGEITFANDEIFTECARPKEGPPDREITRGNISITLDPKPLAYYGLDYDALRLGMERPFRCSDSGGKWLNPGFEETAVKFSQLKDAPNAPQLHLLIHPDWWAQAFTRMEVAA